VTPTQCGPCHTSYASKNRTVSGGAGGGSLGGYTGFEGGNSGSGLQTSPQRGC
jgi:hypothetical protein